MSDLHVGHPENRLLVDTIRSRSSSDWLLVAGDVGERASDVEWALSRLRSRFSTVIWVPGNHELWTVTEDPVQLRGEYRYRYLVDLCRSLGVLTPEDPFPVWEGWGEPVVVAPLFALYDYTFQPAGVMSEVEGLRLAYEAGVVCSDEFLLHPDPYDSRREWCHQRVAETERRLADIDDTLSTVLVNHFPLVREPTRVLWRQEFVQWCGSERTADWHVRFRAKAVVYGHLHIPRIVWCDRVPFYEVSIGYPREWRRRGYRPELREILPTVDEKGSS